jgi:hypothetical protein
MANLAPLVPASRQAVAAALRHPEVAAATYASAAGTADGKAFAAAMPPAVDLNSNVRCAAAHAAIAKRTEITEPRAQQAYQSAFVRASLR